MIEEVETPISADYLWPAMPQYEATIDRKTFEDINKEFFSKCMACTKKVLKKAKIEPAGIDFVVLVGGSTRIPKVRHKSCKRSPKLASQLSRIRKHTFVSCTFL